MITILDKKDCCGCEACRQVCPKSCITMREDHEGFRYPLVNIDQCVDCHACEKVCPQLHPCSSEPEYSAYMACAKDSANLESSSSGGMFGILAKSVIDRGGIVYGAKFSDDFTKIYHATADDTDALKPLQRSKYLQSEIGDTYKEVKKAINEGIEVMYVGTPCQIAGLNRYIGDNHRKLLTVEVMCHGAPSPKVWREYLRNVTKGMRPIDVNFRDKRDGWNDYRVTITTPTRTISHKRYNDPYMMLFVGDVINRPSCSSCLFKAGRSGADITLGDFWGLNPKDIPAGFSDKLGISLLITHSEKGAKAFNAVKGMVNYHEVDSFANTAYSTSSDAHPSRDAFFDAFNSDTAGAILTFSRQFKIKPLIKLKMSLYHMLKG